MTKVAFGVRTVLAVVVTLGLSVFTFSALAHAASSGGIGGRPANPVADNPRTQSIFIYSLDVNQIKDDQVLVSNNSDTIQTVSFYAVDGVVTNTGAYTCKQKSEASVDAGEWVKLSKNQLTLNPGSSEKVDFKVTVPSNASVGEHSACIVFQNDNDEGEVTGSVRLRTRQAIRMSVTVPGDLQRTIAISAFSVNNDQNIQKYSLSLKNTGNVSADVNTLVTMKDLFGGVIYKGGGQYPVMRDQKLDLVLDNNNLPFWGGWYVTQAEISYDKKAGSFGVPDLKQDLVTTSSKPVTVFVTPSIWALVIYAAALMLIIAIIARPFVKRWLNKRRVKNWRYYIVREGDTIQSIADLRNISWNKLARINGLKAPYVLSVGSKLFVPGKKQE